MKKKVKNSSYRFLIINSVNFLYSTKKNNAIPLMRCCLSKCIVLRVKKWSAERKKRKGTGDRWNHAIFIQSLSDLYYLSSVVRSFLKANFYESRWSRLGPSFRGVWSASVNQFHFLSFFLTNVQIDNGVMLFVASDSSLEHRDL